MLISLSECDILLNQLKKISKDIDEDLKIELIKTDDSNIFKFSKHSKTIYVSHNSLKHYEKEDIVFHAINMIRRKGNEEYYNNLKRTPL